MSSVSAKDDLWKSAWPELIVELVALDAEISVGSPESLERAGARVKEATAIEEEFNAR